MAASHPEPENGPQPPTLDYRPGDAQERTPERDWNTVGTGCTSWFIALFVAGTIGADMGPFVGALSLIILPAIGIYFWVRDRRAGFLCGLLAGALVASGLVLVVIAIVNRYVIF